MIEPEMAWHDLEDDCNLAEAFVRHCLSTVLEESSDDLAFFDKRISKGLIERLRSVAEADFERMTYTEAVERLAGRIGYALHYEDGGAAPETSGRTRLYQANAAAADWFRAQLSSPEADAGRRFLGERGFDAGAAALTVAPGDLRAVVGRVVDAASVLADRNGTTVRVLPGRDAVVPMDERRIERILRNLVTNAIEHSDGKPIDIEIGANDSAVAVTVRDRGIGLKPGEAVRVFNRFWRADPARARTTGGTGLGLSISLEDARLHEGWLQAWGAPGEGSCFRLTLPRRAGQPIQRSPLPLAPDDSQVGRIMPAGNSLTLGTGVDADPTESNHSGRPASPAGGDRR